MQKTMEKYEFRFQTRRKRDSHWDNTGYFIGFKI